MNATPEGGSSEDVRDDGRFSSSPSAPASPTSGGPAGVGRRRHPKGSSPGGSSSDDETSSTKSNGSGSGGDHHSLPSIDDVDEIDPEAVDFQPLLLSDSGTAMTYDAHHDHGALRGNVDRQVRRHSWSGDLPLQDEEAYDDDEGGGYDDSGGVVVTEEVEPEGQRGELLAFVFSYFVHEALRAYRLLRIRLLGPAAMSMSPRLEKIGDETGASLSSSFQVCGAFFVVLMVVTVAGGSTTVQRNPEYARAAGGAEGPGGARDPGAPAPNRLASTAAFSGTNLRLPESMDLFRNVDELPMEMTDTAVFWHVPRSGGTTMKHVLSMCLGRVVASEAGADSALDENLEVKQTPYGNYVNVDTTTPLGIQRAKTMGLAQSGQADVVFTPLVHEISRIFDENHRGRFLTVLRDPVDRIVSLYYYRRMATWIPNFDPNAKDRPLSDFVKTHGENWMVRSLVDKMSGPLSESDLSVAKEILRTKFLIGLLDEKTESLRRFESYFGWKLPSPVAQTCKNNAFYFEWQGKNRYPQLGENSEERQLIRNLNKYDVELYEYAVGLFEGQRVLFWNDDEDGAKNEFGWGPPLE